jgi:DNA-binding SARP family transcriptional activator/pimeloyl-ACP methyl ester carboxylesterase
VRVSVLGPLEVESDLGVVELAAAKERSLVAALALNVGSVVSAERLIDALWGDEPPPTARKTLQTYVSNIRRTFGSDVVTTEPNGYVLRVAPEDVDVYVFRRLMREGQTMLSGGSARDARERLGEAVTLWRGEPLAGAGAHTGLAAERVCLWEEYLSALETRIAADLAAGYEGDLISELQALVREHPFRERLWGHLMVAMYRTGRQADALATYQRAREVLRDELGLEPGGELQRLERAVLAHDPSLDTPPQGGDQAPAADRLFRSPVRYARSKDGVHIAYQVVGDGPIDVLCVPGFVCHLDMYWDAPTDDLVRRLSSFSRLILFDKRGMGLSDRPEHVDAEDWVEDACAVLDAVGSERAVILGISAGGCTAALLAAAHPERVHALVIYGGYARILAGDGYELGSDPDSVESFIAGSEANWGTSFGLEIYAPSRASDPSAQAYIARCGTIAASPHAAATFLRALTQIDIRHALPSITAPTLILHAARDRQVPIEVARYTKEHIPGATLVELDSDIHLLWLSDVVDDIAQEIEKFVARTVPNTVVDRSLATVLAVSPDAQPDHAPLISQVIERCGGRALKYPGVATFDGPARAIRCAIALTSEINHNGDQIAVAVHSGECRIANGDVDGVAVDIARQLASTATRGQVLVSQTIKDLVVGSAIKLVPHGRCSFSDVPGEWDIFSVLDATTAPSAAIPV